MRHDEVPFIPSPPMAQHDPHAYWEQQMIGVCHKLIGEMNDLTQRMSLFEDFVKFVECSQPGSVAAFVTSKLVGQKLETGG